MSNTLPITVTCPGCQRPVTVCVIDAGIGLLVCAACRAEWFVTLGLSEGEFWPVESGPANSGRSPS